MKEDSRLYEFTSELLVKFYILSQNANPLSFHAAHNLVTICKTLHVAVL